MRLLAAVLVAASCAAVSASAQQPQQTQESPLKRGMMLHTYGRLAEAEEVYREVLAGPTQGWDRGRAMTVLALNLHIRGRRGEAEALYRSSIEFHRERFPREVGLPTEGLGILLLENGDAEGAAPFLRDGLAHAREEAAKRGKRDPYFLAGAISRMGDLLAAQGNADAALSAYEEAIGLFGNQATSFAFQVLDAELIDAYPIIMVKAADLKRAKGKVDDARLLYSRSLAAWAGWERVTERRQPMKARMIDYQGRANLGLGELEEGRKQLELAAAHYATLYGESDSRAIAAARIVKRSRR